MFGRGFVRRMWGVPIDSDRYREAVDPQGYRAPNHPREVARRQRQIARGLVHPVYPSKP